MPQKRRHRQEVEASRRREDSTTGFTLSLTTGGCYSVLRRNSILRRWVNKGMKKGRSPNAPALRPHDGSINAKPLGVAPAEERFRAAASCPCCLSYSTPPRSCPQQCGR